MRIVRSNRKATSTKNHLAAHETYFRSAPKRFEKEECNEAEAFDRRVFTLEVYR
jgi:hypothetical protein